MPATLNDYIEVYRDIQAHDEEKHDNAWEVPKWTSKTNFLDWDDDLRNAMTDMKFSVDKHTRIMYLICEENDPVDDADLPPGLQCEECRILQVPLEGSAYAKDNKDLYAKLFEATHKSIAGLYVQHFSHTKNGRSAYLAIKEHFMGDDAMNRAKEQAYVAIDAAKYRGESPNFSFEIYCLIYEKNMRILERNGEAMPQGRAVQKFMKGIEPAWFTAGKAFINSLDAHKNNFPKAVSYLASYVKHPQGGMRHISSICTG